MEDLYNNTPDGCICDADTILKDLMDNVDMEISGIAMDVFHIWKAAQTKHEKESIEDMFLIFTGVEFEDYLEKCVKETTRSNNTCR